MVMKGLRDSPLFPCPRESLTAGNLGLGWFSPGSKLDILAPGYFWGCCQVHCKYSTSCKYKRWISGEGRKGNFPGSDNSLVYSQLENLEIKRALLKGWSQVWLHRAAVAARSGEVWLVTQSRQLPAGMSAVRCVPASACAVTACPSFRRMLSCCPGGQTTLSPTSSSRVSDVSY